MKKSLVIMLVVSSIIVIAGIGFAVYKVGENEENGNIVEQEDVANIRIVGVWSNYNEVTFEPITDTSDIYKFEFKDNLECTCFYGLYQTSFGISGEGTYSIQGDKLILNIEFPEQYYDDGMEKMPSWNKNEIYKFSIKGNRLTLTSENEEIVLDKR